MTAPEPRTPARLALAEGAAAPGPSADAPGDAPHDFMHVALETLEHVLRLPEPPESRWHRAGVSPRGERIFERFSAALLLLLVVGWSWSIADAAHARAEGDEDAGDPTANIAASLTSPDAPSAAFLTGAALEALTPLRGASGKLRVAIRQPGEPVADSSAASGARVTVSGGDVGTSGKAPAQPGIWRAALAVGSAIKPVTDFSVISLVPFSRKQGGRVGLYYLGSWPNEKARRAVRPGYAPPSGFIEVTAQNANTQVSEHFRLKDFLTHGQENVWPKYLVLQPKLLDKLELVLADLEAHGVRTSGVHIMSGFRTPSYNRTGGDPSGRASLSRHMYGDASDIYIDNDGNGSMDDLNHDGRVDIRDARVIQDAVDRVERAHPDLVGGCGVYVASGGHGPFTHIDVRGYRARWVGTGDG